MRKILVMVADLDGNPVEKEFRPEDLDIEGDDWDEADVESALDMLAECMPSAFIHEDGVPIIEFEIVESRFTVPVK